MSAAQEKPVAPPMNPQTIFTALVHDLTTGHLELPGFPDGGAG